MTLPERVGLMPWVIGPPADKVCSYARQLKLLHRLQEGTE